MLTTKRTMVLFALAVLLANGCSEQSSRDVTPAQTAQVATANQVTELREITLSVPDMSCPMCPITVRRALQGVEGVEAATVSLEEKQAIVQFDPAETNAAELIAATTDAGFPSRRKE